MDALGLARLGLGLIGIFAAVQGVIAFPRLAGTSALLAGEYGAATAVLTVLLPFLAIWIVCYYLVFANLGLARLLSGQAQALPESAESLAPGRVLVGLAGVLIVAYSLPGVITSVGVIVELGSYSREREFWKITVAYLAQAGIGVFLVLRPDVLLKLWSRGRE